MDEYMVELGGYEYAVQAGSPEEARQKGLLAHVKSVGQQSVDQAVGDATMRREEALASAPMSPWAESAMAGMSGEGGAYADPNATGEDIIKRGAGMAAMAGAGATGAGMIAAPVATMKGLAGGLLGSAVGGEAGEWVGRRVPVVGGETLGNVLGAAGGLVGGIGGGMAAPKIDGRQLLSMIPGGGRGGLLQTILGGVEGAAPKAATKAAGAVDDVVSQRLKIQAEKVAAARERNALLKRKLDLQEAKQSVPKPGPKAVPKAAPATEGATALKPEPELIPDEAVSLVAEPLPFKPRPAKGTTTMATNLGGKAKPGPPPTPPDKLEEALRASIKEVAEESALKAPRVAVGAERVGKAVGKSKEEVRVLTGPVVGEANGAASPVFPQNTFDGIWEKMLAMPRGGGERKAYAAAAPGEKAMTQVETMRRAMEKMGYVVPVAAIVEAIRRKVREGEPT